MFEHRQIAGWFRRKMSSISNSSECLKTHCLFFSKISCCTWTVGCQKIVHNIRVLCTGCFYFERYGKCKIKFKVIFFWQLTSSNSEVARQSLNSYWSSSLWSMIWIVHCKSLFSSDIDVSTLYLITAFLLWLASSWTDCVETEISLMYKVFGLANSVTGRWTPA